MNGKHGTLRLTAAMTLPIGMAGATVGLALWLAVTGAPRAAPRSLKAQVVVIDDLPPVPCPMVGNSPAC